MRMHLTLPNRLHAHAHAHEVFEDGPLHQTWDLNRGLFAMSGILIAWVLVAIMTIDGLGGLSRLPWMPT